VQGAPAVQELAEQRRPTEGEPTPTLEAKPERRLAAEESAAAERAAVELAAEAPAAQQAPAEPLVRAAQTPAMQPVGVAQLAPVAWLALVARLAPVAVPVVRLTAAERQEPAAAGWTAAPGRPAQVAVRTPAQTAMAGRRH
jgi:hypothetical protein